MQLSRTPRLAMALRRFGDTLVPGDLERLLRHRGATVARSEIEDSLYAFGAEIESNAVEVYISRLRKKLGKDFVKTARGLGYQVSA